MYNTDMENDDDIQYYDYDVVSLPSIADDDVNQSNDMNNIIIDETHCKVENTGKVFSIVYDFCCICGVDELEHSNKRHKYFGAKDEYTCKKCGLFFFEHTHNSNGCYFTPTNYISQHK